MKQLRISVLLISFVSASLLLQGCAAVLVGGVIAGTAYGTVKYSKNTLSVTEQVTLNKAWASANATVKALGYRATASGKDSSTARLDAKTAKDQPVRIDLTFKSETSTEIEITVGTFESPDNRAKEDQIYNQMKSRF